MKLTRLNKEDYFNTINLAFQELEQKLDNAERARQNLNEELARQKSKKCLIRLP